jgi:hypothetical protein
MQPARRPIEPPPGLDPAVAKFIEELARAAVRRQNRAGKTTGEASGQADDRE